VVMPGIMPRASHRHADDDDVVPQAMTFHKPEFWIFIRSVRLLEAAEEDYDGEQYSVGTAEDGKSEKLGLGQNQDGWLLRRDQGR